LTLAGAVAFQAVAESKPFSGPAGRRFAYYGIQKSHRKEFFGFLLVS